MFFLKLCCCQQHNLAISQGFIPTVFVLNTSKFVWQIHINLKYLKSKLYVHLHNSKKKKIVGPHLVFYPSSNSLKNIKLEFEHFYQSEANTKFKNVGGIGYLVVSLLKIGVFI